MSPERLAEILDFAIREEEAAYRFYLDLAAKMDKAYMKEIFEDFAKEELRHKAKLEGVKKGDFFTASFQTIEDLKIGDYLVDVDTSQDMDYHKALVLAMKKEKAAYRLYSDLAARAEDARVKDVFKALAQEEAKHKLRFEIEYDNAFLREN